LDYIIDVIFCEPFFPPASGLGLLLVSRCG
jgi:hypothetical protein